MSANQNTPSLLSIQSKQSSQLSPAFANKRLSIKALAQAARAKHKRSIVMLLVCLPLVILWSMSSGALDLALLYIIQAWIFASDMPAEAAIAGQILWEIRLPRIGMTIFTGAGLALCGVVLQSLCRNPLADPGLIGVSSGAALFAAFGFLIVSVYALPAWLPNIIAQSFIPSLAAMGAGLALFLLLKIANGQGGINTLMLILSGVAINAGAMTLLGFITYIVDDATLRQITFWSMGSYAGIDHSKLLISAGIVCLALVFFMRHIHPLMLISTGEKQAKFQGVDVNKVKTQSLLMVALVVAVCVSFTGIVGFVGLVVPHICRLMLGAHLRILMPASVLLGAILVTVADTLARTLIIPAELPIGLLTSLIGVPFFLYLILREKRKLAHV
ncbi:FecCD family ABC transporter permease [Glaciecola sp. SC05]|uniref:FecCD family ABC transporter permease n=1 Tax=Glaciecola sp. SC05 TaxID=1987355 RepID=UPI003528DD88